MAREQQAGKRESPVKRESKAAARSSRGVASSERRPSSAADSEAPIMAASAGAGNGGTGLGKTKEIFNYRGWGFIFAHAPPG